MLKRTKKNLLSTISIICFGVFQYFGCNRSSTNTKSIEVFFSPTGGCLQTIIESIHESKSEVLVQAFSFTSKNILEALLAAKHRGVVIKCIMDKGQAISKGSLAKVLAENIDDFVIDNVQCYAHSKVMIIDRKIVLTGSYNFTNNAEYHNSENLLKIKDEKIASIYSQEWHKRRMVLTINSKDKLVFPKKPYKKINFFNSPLNNQLHYQKIL